MRILVAVDKSPESHMALRYVCHLLEHFDAQVDALYVKPDVLHIVLEDFDVPFLRKKDPRERVEAEAREVEQEIVNACEVCLAGKVRCEPRAVVGEPTEEILNAAQAGEYDLIALGSHGRSSLKGFLLGAVHSKILHHASRPVLIAREERQVHRILVAYRGSSCDQSALRFIAPLLSRKKPEVTVLHVQETSLGESDGFAEACLLQGERTLSELAYAPITKAAQGDFVEEALREIATGDYDLVVLGAYGHERPKVLKVISDEALTIVSRTLCPVLVYRDRVRG
jgi:nucleotide-binding universal stress UspA family protein